MKSYAKNVAKSVNAEMAKRHKAAGLILENAFKRQLTDYGLVDTGHLRANQTHDARDDGVIAGTNVPYAPPVAFGWDRDETSWRPPGNYMLDGTTRALPELRRVYGAGMK